MKLAGAFALVIILVPIGISPPKLIASWQMDWMLEGYMMALVLMYPITLMVLDVLEGVLRTLRSYRTSVIIPEEKAIP